MLLRFFFLIYDRNSNLNSHTRIFEPMASAHDGCSYHQAKTPIGFWCRRDLSIGIFQFIHNRILNKTHKKYKYIMHFKKGILGIWLKYNVIPPRYYTVPNYGINIQSSIHVLLSNWWIVILISLQLILFLVILIPITV